MGIISRLAKSKKNKDETELQSNADKAEVDLLDQNAITAKISKGLLESIQAITKERNKFYEKNPAPDLKNLDKLVKKYCNQNAAISGTVGLVPGPWGMAAALPEIILIMKQQMKMIYDIGKSYGHDKISSELLLLVTVSGAGIGAGTLLVMHGQKIMAKRVGQRALQKLITILGGKITQQAAKAAAAKWLPVAGAVGMAAWSKYSTKKAADRAIDIFSKEIEFVDDEVTDSELDSLALENKETNRGLPEYEKIKAEALINLIKVDGKIENEERVFLENILEGLSLEEAEKNALKDSLNSPGYYDLDYGSIQENRDECLMLVIDLIGLSKADGNIHPEEISYIKNIASNLGFSDQEIEDFLSD